MGAPRGVPPPGSQVLCMPINLCTWAPDRKCQCPPALLSLSLSVYTSKKPKRLHIQAKVYLKKSHSKAQHVQVVQANPEFLTLGTTGLQSIQNQGCHGSVVLLLHQPKLLGPPVLDGSHRWYPPRLAEQWELGPQVTDRHLTALTRCKHLRPPPV